MQISRKVGQTDMQINNSIWLRLLGSNQRPND